MTALLLGYRDIERARNFFVSARGFEEVWSVTNDAGELTRSHVRLDETVLMLDKPGAHGVLGPAEAGGLTHLVVIQVEDVNAHYERAVDQGAAVLVGPAERPWGRDYEVRDPEGYVFSFFEE